MCLIKVILDFLSTKKIITELFVCIIFAFFSIANHNVSVPFRVVIINAEVNKINLNFDNSINEIIDNQSEIKQIFDENFDGWEFNIDKVEDPGNSKENTNKNSGSARVACYFLEIETYDPVSNSIAKV